MITNLVKQERDKSVVKIQEKEVREKLEKEHFTDKEKKLDRLEIEITSSVYEHLLRFFTFMKHNIKEKNVSKMFMTEDSINVNLKKYFGHKTSFLDERLYFILSKG